jgi:hypothetical protein
MTTRAVLPVQPCSSQLNIIEDCAERLVIRPAQFIREHLRSILPRWFSCQPAAWKCESEVISLIQALITRTVEHASRRTSGIANNESFRLRGTVTFQPILYQRTRRQYLARVENRTTMPVKTTNTLRHERGAIVKQYGRAYECFGSKMKDCKWSPY